MYDVRGVSGCLQKNEKMNFKHVHAGLAEKGRNGQGRKGPGFLAAGKSVSQVQRVVESGELRRRQGKSRVRAHEPRRQANGRADKGTTLPSLPFQSPPKLEAVAQRLCR